jgi:hypothetical protein
VTEALADLSQAQSASKRGLNRDVPSSQPVVRFVDPLAGPEWDRLVLSHPDCNFFHTAAWAKVLCETYSHKPFYMSLSERGKLLALVPMMEVRSAITGQRGVCVPFADFCEPLVFDGCESKLVIETLARIARERNWKYFEVRGRKTFQFSSVPAVAFYGHQLDLRSGSEELFACLASSVRRAIRKAEKSGLCVRVSQASDAINEFYRLHVQTRKRHGLPPQPASFFLRIQEDVIKAGLGFVVLAASGSRAVAAAVFFQTGKKAVYKFGACDTRFQEFRGNNFVMWEGIKYLAQHGAEGLHLGRTSLENDGLRRFKLSWGAKEEKIEYFRFDPATNTCLTGRDNASGFHNTVFARLPARVNQLIGALVYPHLD